jgi:acetyl esterase
LQRRFTSEAEKEKDTMTLHPVVDAIMQAMRGVNFPAFSECSPAEARAALEAMRGAAPPRPIPPLADIRDSSVAENPPVLVRAYLPEGAVQGTIVYMHGGGWVTGDLETSHAPAAALAAFSQCRVVSVDYRLAPEHPYPAALDDVMQVIAWAAAQGGPVLVAGDSAGGNLAAAATLRARATGGPAIAGQILIYPALDPAMESDSHRKNSPLNYILTTEDMRWFWTHYAGTVAHEDMLVAPSLAATLEGLPPAFVAVASHDVLRDEGIAYADRLRDAGVETEIHVYEGMVHGFVAFLGVVDTADRALHDMGGWARSVARRAAPAILPE